MSRHRCQIGRPFQPRRNAHSLGDTPIPATNHSADPKATWQQLYDRGVLVRDVGIPGHLRVSAGTEAETTAFLDALASIGSAS